MNKIIEYVKLLGMTVVYTAGQAIAFWVVLPVWYALINNKKDGGD